MTDEKTAPLPKPPAKFSPGFNPYAYLAIGLSLALLVATHRRGRGGGCE
jgi:hypothetical protein